MKQQWNTLSEKFFPYTLYHLESPEVKKPQFYHSPSFALLLPSRPNPPSLSGSSFSARESTSMPLWPLRRDMIFITPVNAAWCDYWLDTQWSRNTEDTLIDTTESWIHHHHQHHQLHTTTNMIIRIVVAIFTPPEALMITVISERFTVLIVNATVFVTKTHVKPDPNPSLRAGFEARKWHRWHLHGWRFFHRHLGSKLRFWGSVWWISSDLYMIYQFKRDRIIITQVTCSKIILMMKLLNSLGFPLQDFSLIFHRFQGCLFLHSLQESWSVLCPLATTLLSLYHLILTHMHISQLYPTP